MSTLEREIAQKQQEKFDFYLVSLVFTLLALSIQTATFGASNIADFCELIGWALLLISGIAGLSRLEYLPIEREKHALREEYRDQAINMQQIGQSGQNEIFVVENDAMESVAEKTRQLQNAVKTLTPVLSDLEKNGLIKYQIHKYCFVVALLCLLLARAFLPAKSIFFTVLQS